MAPVSALDTVAVLGSAMLVPCEESQQCGDELYIGESSSRQVRSREASTSQPSNKQRQQHHDKGTHRGAVQREGGSRGAVCGRLHIAAVGAAQRAIREACK